MSKRILRALLVPGLLLCAENARASGGLRGEQSAFLKAYADSPVDWMPWGDAAVARATGEKKPVFLFVGSFTSELSGAMRRQTFANPKTAAWLNTNFVCVIVDREERPDVAALYQAYVSNLKQLSGWPLNVWLTPELQPFEGATYLSPSEDWGAPGFLKLANQAKTAWDTNPAACRKRAAESASQLAPPPSAAPAAWDPEKARARLSADAAAWRATLDPVNGGYGDLPRSLEPELIRFMLLQSAQDRDSARMTLRALASSAVRDPLDGGFFRHAADAAWHLPYQQKTLSDQARIALAFLSGADGGDAKSFTQCARGALDFALGRLGRADGTFAAAEDATGDEFAGYYAWTDGQIDSVLGKGSQAFKAAHGVLPGGNVPAADDPSAQFAQKNLLRSLAETDARQASAAALLLAARDRRRAPPKDDRATAEAYGLILDALATAGAQLHEPRYLDAARRTLDAIRRDLVVASDGTLLRLGGTHLPAAAEDYGAVALGCRALARAAKGGGPGALASLLLAQLDSRFLDPASGAYFGAASPPGPGFFIRPFAVGDPPSAESLAVLARSPHAKAVAASLSESLEESGAQAPGDQLLALATFALGNSGN